MQKQDDYETRIGEYLRIISHNENISTNQELLNEILKEDSTPDAGIYNLTRIQRDLRRYISEYKKSNPTAKVNLRGPKKFELLRNEAKKHFLSERDREIFTVHCTKIREQKVNNVYIWTKEGCADRVAHYIRNRFGSIDADDSQNDRLFVIADYDSVFIHFKNPKRRKEFMKLLRKYIVPSKNGLLLPPVIHQSTKKENTEENTD